MKVYTWLLLSACLTGLGCAKPEIDEVLLATQFQGAEQAINNAAELAAEALVPEEFGRAVKLLNFARNSQEEGDIPQSAEFAYQAELVAQIAIAKARQYHAKQKSVSIREQTYQQSIKALEHEFEIERTQRAITEEQLARALKLRDEVQQQITQRATEIADFKTKLRQATLRAPISGLERFVNLTTAIYPAIKGTADYERVQTAITLIVNLIEQQAFAETENATTEAETLVNDLYQFALQKHAAETEAKTNAQISIAQVEIIIQRAQDFNATQHASKQLQEAHSQLTHARRELAENRYEQVQQAAQQAQQAADNALTIAAVTESRQRAQQELNALTARARQAVDNLGKKITAQAKTQVPQLAVQLYQLAHASHHKAKTALTAKEYQNVLKAVEEANDYLEHAIAKTNQLTSAKSNLLLASKQIPIATAIEQPNSILVRINGNVFAHGSTQIQETFHDTFTHLAKVLRTPEFRKYRVRIEAHTSALGDEKSNRKISVGRADSIKKFLTTQGHIDTQRLTAEGLGETRPIAKDGSDKEEKNRRIDIIIITN